MHFILPFVQYLDSHFQYTLKVMAVSESSRLRGSLKKENVPVKRLIVNQVLPPSSSDCKFCAMKRKVQYRSVLFAVYGFKSSESSSIMVIVI